MKKGVKKQKKEKEQQSERKSNTDMKKRQGKS